MEFILSNQKKVVVTCQSLPNFLGIQSHALIGQDFNCVLSEIVPERLKEDLYQTIDNGNDYETTVKFKGEKGAWADIHISSTSHDSDSYYQVKLNPSDKYRILETKQVFKMLFMKTHSIEQGWIIANPTY